MFADPLLTLDSLLLGPPAPALIALAIAFGLYALGLAIARLVFGSDDLDALEQAAGFVLAVALLASMVHALALLGLASPASLRALGVAIVVFGAYAFTHRRRMALAAAMGGAWRTGIETRGWRRLLYGLSVLTLLGLLTASLAPPTDIDSLAYHVSLPLTWLAGDGARATPYWLHARLIGIGESIVMLGLAMGTDCLGSLLQASGLLVAIAAVRSAARSHDDRLLALLLVLACPIWTYMVLTSKPQLLPAAATTAALALWLRHARGTPLLAGTMPARELLALFACLLFAGACKYSFLPGAAMIGTVVAIRAYGAGGIRSLLPVAATATLAFVVLVLPVWLRNVWFYGDPVTPVLEKLKAMPEPAVVTFSWYLRNFAGEHSLHNLLRLPWTLVVPTGPGHFTTVLGAGALALLAAIDGDRGRQLVLLLAVAVTMVAALVGQLQARFFVEPYLWCALAVVGAGWSLRKRVLRALLALQLPASAAVAAFAVYLLVPAAVTDGARESVLVRHAPDYAAARWLNEVLPSDAVLAIDRRSVLYLERPSVPHDYAQQTELSRLPVAEKNARILSWLRDAGVNTLVITEPVGSSVYAWLAAGAGAPIARSPRFEDAVRNPWRKGTPYVLLVFEVRNHPSLRSEN